MGVQHFRPADDRREGASVSTENQKVDAGCFSSWLRRIRYALLTDTGSDVPCGTCRACCISSYFIHIHPEETATIRSIPEQLLFPAPGLPKGNVLLGYLGDGSCPMLENKGCMVYDVRSKTCRAYDCRIFSAAGIRAGGKEKRAVNQQLEKWRFSYPTPTDLRQHEAVKSAARFLLQNKNAFPDKYVPDNLSLVAVCALRVYPVFMQQPVSHLKNLSRVIVQEYVQRIVEENRRFSAACI